MAEFGVDRYGKPQGYDQMANPYKQRPAAPGTQIKQPQQPQDVANGATAQLPMMAQGITQFAQNAQNAQNHQMYGAPQSQMPPQQPSQMSPQQPGTGMAAGIAAAGAGLSHYANTGVSGYAPGGMAHSQFQPTPPPQAPAPPPVGTPQPPPAPPAPASGPVDYSRPGQYLPGNGSGYDPTKGLDGGNTGKYKMRNVLSHFDPNAGLTPEVVNALNAAGIGKFRMADGDELVLDDAGADPSFGRTRHFDVVPNSADKSIQHTWGYLQQDKGGVMGGQGAPMGAPPPTSYTPPPSPGAPCGALGMPSGAPNMPSALPSSGPGMTNRVGQLPTTALPEYTPSTIAQFAAPQQGDTEGMQKALLQQILSNPHSMSDQNVNQLKQQSIEEQMGLMKQGMNALGQGFASRGMTNSGGVDAGNRRLFEGLGSAVLGSNRAIDLSKMQQDRQDELGALGAGDSFLNNQMSRATQGYNTGLAGQMAQTSENQFAHGSKADAVKFALQNALDQQNLNLQGQGLDINQQQVGNQNAQFGLSHDLANRQFADAQKQWRARLGYDYNQGALDANKSFWQ